MSKSSQFSDFTKTLSFYNDAGSSKTPHSSSSSSSSSNGSWAEKFNILSSFTPEKSKASSSSSAAASTSVSKPNDSEASTESSSLVSWTKGVMSSSVSTVKNLKSSATTNASQAVNLARNGQRIKYFVVLMLIGVVCFFLAFTFLPMVVIRPSKFSLLFTLGSLCFMGSFAFLRGPWEHFKYLTSLDRLPFTAIYFFTMFGTLYAALISQSYIAVVFFSCAQLVALLWYSCSHLPGGTRGLQVVTKVFTRAVGKLFGCQSGSSWLPM